MTSFTCVKIKRGLPRLIFTHLNYPTNLYAWFYNHIVAQPDVDITSYPYFFVHDRFSRALSSAPFVLSQIYPSLGRAHGPVPSPRRGPSNNKIRLPPLSVNCITPLFLINFVVFFKDFLRAGASMGVVREEAPLGRPNGYCCLSVRKR